MLELIPEQDNEYKKQWIKLMDEVGMAVHESIQTRVVSLGIIKYILHPYCFSLKYYHLKSHRDVTCTVSNICMYMATCVYWINGRQYSNRKLCDVACMNEGVGIGGGCALSHMDPKDDGNLWSKNQQNNP